MLVVTNIEKQVATNIVPNITDESIGAILGNVAASARAKWLNFGRRDESTFARDYVQSIQPEQRRSATEYAISLVGEVAHLLEDGAPRLDMRTTLLGPNVPIAEMGQRGKHKNKDGGYFRAIPLRHSMGNAGAAGPKMGSSYSGHDAVSSASALGQAVYRAAKNLKATTTDPYSGKTQWGGRLKTNRIRAGLAKGQKGIPLLKPHHKSDIYKGMIRTEKTYEKATQSQYFTFRTISTSVNDESWWRKPIRARAYAKQVNAFIEKVLPMAFEAFFGGQNK